MLEDDGDSRWRVSIERLYCGGFAFMMLFMVQKVIINSLRRVFPWLVYT
jgi:hypothetical protein